MRRIYFDNGATSYPKAPGVSRAVSRFLDEECVNVNRTYGSRGRKEEENLFSMREKTAEVFGATGRIPVFSSGLTESMNTIISGFLTDRDHVITTSFEHNAVLRALTLHNISFSLLPDDGRGNTLFDSFNSLVRSNTRALIINAASNVSGITADLEKAAECASSHDLALIVDSAQASPFCSMDFNALGISALVFTAHKGFMGPEGLGGMILSEDFAERLNPLIAGGTGSISDSLDMPSFLPDKFEAGLHDYAGIVGTGAALDYLSKVGMDEVMVWDRTLMGRILSNLEDVRNLHPVGPADAPSRGGVFSFNIDGLGAHDIAMMLDSMAGVMIRSGMHCAHPFYVSRGIDGSARASTYIYNSLEEIDIFTDTVRHIAETFGD